MKTHMLKMHNINIDDHPEANSSSIVGGVMCDICQKELCSKVSVFDLINPNFYNRKINFFV